MAHFSEDSGDSSNQEEEYESEAGESEERDTDEFIYLDEQLERPSTAGGPGAQGQRTLQAPQTMQWAIRPREAVTTSSTTRPPTTTTTTSTAGIQDI